MPPVDGPVTFVTTTAPESAEKEQEMKRVTDFFPTQSELQFAFDQIEKYNPGVAVFRETSHGYAVYRVDMKEKRPAKKKAAVVK